MPESAMRTDIGVSAAAYNDVQKLESVHALPHHPKLLALYKTLFADEVLVHARHIIRMISPHPAVFPTPPHQDFPLIQGTQNTWTCWFPLGDCPRELGSLKVLRGSHKLGYLPLKPAKGAGAIAIQTCPWEEHEDDWIEGDFALGDVLTFPAFTVHKALPSQFPDRIRLSFDVRYQPLSEPVEEKSLLPHCGLTWEQVYENWHSDELQYYWRRLPLTYSGWNPKLLQPERRIC
ncbi:MAG: phytanoyl-CoA dioxygenase family protein [Armatimonadetes bacterium]|nr:phytanoyl-CoA dioxygenase family protein [Armatimonadota bacterium]